MEFAYFDESGDLGAKGSKKLVVCLVCTRQSKKLDKIIRKIKQRLLEKSKTSKWLNKMGGEVKFYSFPDKPLLIKSLKDISKLDIKIYYICFDKKGNKLDKKSKEDILIYLFKHIFEKPNKERPEKIISDRDFLGEKVNRPSYFLLKCYKCEEIKQLGENSNKIEKLRELIKFEVIGPQKYKEEKGTKDNFPIKIEPKISKGYHELQAVDLICGSIFQFVENNDSKYFDIIKDKVEMWDKI